MKISFYAPLKPISSPKPSGDRLIGRLLNQAMIQAGHDVSVASTFRSYDGKGDQLRQQRLKNIGQKKAVLLSRRLKQNPPDMWFTYHLYRKAPDWLGPIVCRDLGIPYVVAEASFAPSQAGGDWAEGHIAVQDALSQVDLAIGMTAADEYCLLPELGSSATYFRVKPFLDTRPFVNPPAQKNQVRLKLIASYALKPDVPWLLTVAMMRPGVKFQSFQVLADALRLCMNLPWQLLVAGDGPYRDKVHSLFSDMQDRIVWLGEKSAEDIAFLYAASDVYVWPSVRESPGMTFLEAQASGLPVIGGDGGGVPDVIEHDVGGFLAPRKDAKAFSGYLKTLLNDPERRREMGIAARKYVQANHTIEAAADRLNTGFSKILP